MFSKTIVTFLSLILFPQLLLGQNILVTNICEKNYSSEKILTDTAAVLFGNMDPLLQDACSWKCNSYIRTPAVIKETVDESDSLADHTINSSCTIPFPIGKKIDYLVYIDRYSAMDTLSKKDERKMKDVALEGFLVANGNRNSYPEYVEYARIKKVKIFVNKKMIGFALLKDTPKVQYVHFGKSYSLSFNSKVELSIEIEEVYPGTKHEELAISELHLDGSGGHSITRKFCWQE